MKLTENLCPGAKAGVPDPKVEEMPSELAKNVATLEHIDFRLYTNRHSPETACAHRFRCEPFLGRVLRGVTVFVLASFPLHALADSKAGETKAQLCILCHKSAPDKRFVPLLEQQPAEYLVAAITAYKTRQRVENSMNVNAANLSGDDMRDIADYFASKALPIRIQNLEPAKIAAGAKLVRDMSCVNCHDGTFHGAKMVPRLAGQNVMYLVGQMEAFRDGRRNMPTAMVVPKDRTDIEDVASYLASLP